MEQMRKSWLGRSNYILPVLVALLFIPALYAQPSSTTDATRREPQDPPICKFLSSQLDRPIDSFQRDFGVVISRTQHKVKLPSQVDQYGELIKIQFEHQTSLSYVVVGNAGSNLREMIVEIEMNGLENLRKLGLNVYSIEDIKRLFGKPDSSKANIMTYECDMYFVDFSVSSPNSVTVRIGSHID